METLFVRFVHLAKVERMENKPRLLAHILNGQSRVCSWSGLTEQFASLSYTVQGYSSTTEQSLQQGRRAEVGGVFEGTLVDARCSSMVGYQAIHIVICRFSLRPLGWAYLHYITVSATLHTNKERNPKAKCTMRDPASLSPS